MRRTVCTCVGGVFLCSLACLGDTIKVGTDVYEDVYVTESSSKYLVCIPDDGRIVSVPKSEVPSENPNIAQDRYERKALFDKWLAKRKENRGILSSRPRDGTVDNTPPPSPMETVPYESGRASQPSVLVHSPSPNHVVDAARAQQDDLKAQQHAIIAAKRREREAAKLRELANRRVITSQDVRGNSVQWNNAVQWNNSAKWNNNGGQFGFNYRDW